jgi:integrase/recombinase XerD
MIKLLFWRKDSPVTLMQAITEFMQYREKACQVGEIKNATLIRNYMICMNIERFMKSHDLTGIRLEDISPKFANDFYLWIQSDRDAGKAYAAKNIQILKAVVNHAILNGHIKFNVLAPLRFKRGFKKRVLYLQPEEVRTLEAWQFASVRLQQVADLFILQCHTGFSYADLASFDLSQHIEKDESGKEWIIKPRSKNSEEAVLPLFEGAKTIIDKYSVITIQGRKLILPKISNQKYNSYLKEIADILGYKIALTTHIGRKTFGTIALNNGFSLEAVSKMLGHTSVKTTETHYAVILKKRIIGEI